MSDPTAELSSIASALEELTGRIVGVADQMANLGRETVSAELFEVERSLIAGQRRLSKLVNR